MGRFFGRSEGSVAHNLSGCRKSPVASFKSYSGFRHSRGYRVARALNDVVRDTYIPNLTNLVFEGEAIPPPRQIPWCADFGPERLDD
jgi:hypothetical protein